MGFVFVPVLKNSVARHHDAQQKRSSLTATLAVTE
jgi:hypothetical protein